ncbi:MAG: hypothetical protein IJU57_06715 [Clostridia bacterium]|nr:hypothetical protein [Clostridia bacterium]
MKFKKILSAFLTLVMICGIFTWLPTGVSAAYADKVDEDGNPLINYMTRYYENADDKLTDMVLVREAYGYELWYEEFTGEIAVRVKSTGQTYFSNPYDVAYNDYFMATKTKQQLLSQLIITYLDNGVEKTMNSYVEAALRNQIVMKPIKNGIRVEYTIGEEAVTRLVPRVIEKSRFESLILSNITNDWDRNKLISYYDYKDSNDPTLTEKMVALMQAAFPITQQMAVYVCSDTIVARELKEAENIVKKYCPEYTYEELEYDHELTGYVGSDAAPPRFRMAIEYTLNENGLEARLPANGLQFDESVYQFKTVTMLPYFGAGSNLFTGYTMIPDGSGAIIRFEDFINQSINIAGQLYGPDYAYHEITGQHSEVMRTPVYGVVTNVGEYSDPQTDLPEIPKHSDGFLAIISEGDSLATLMATCGGAVHPYSTVYPSFTPRPSDQYNLADSISVSGNATWTVTSKRKYTESYKIQYIFLTDEKLAEKNGVKDYYTADWVGMATAYRDYLTARGDLVKMNDTKEDIPLYIETFGATKTTDRVLSFPVEKDLALTSFEDIKTMYLDLKEQGISNIGFKLTGYANGGLVSGIPYNLSWADVTGGADGFRDLVQYAKDNDIGIYPDFDFAYAQKDSLFDGFTLKSHAIRTIDDRYTTKREYNAALQLFTQTFKVAISPSVYSYMYDAFGPKYAEYGNKAISVSSLGTDLSSDFDEDEPYHREDSKGFTSDLLEKMKEDGMSIMVSGGNAYTVKYADVILDASLTSSKYTKASESIPFTGLVYHGSKVFTGQAINMQGDINEGILNAIENGATIYFLLSYKNTSVLKEDTMMSRYYSVDYGIWKDDIDEYYNILNDATKDLQSSYIIGHEFLEAERIPDEEEIAFAKSEKEREFYVDLNNRITKLEENLRTERRKARIAVQEAGGVWDPSTFTSTIPEQIEELKKEKPNLDDFALIKEGEINELYATQRGSVVAVKYEGDVSFILNYNSFDVIVEYEGTSYTVPSLGFLRID